MHEVVVHKVWNRGENKQSTESDLVVCGTNPLNKGSDPCNVGNDLVSR